MSAQPSLKKRRWILPLIIISILAIFLAFSNEGSVTADGLPKVDTLGAYRDEMVRAGTLLDPIFAKADRGEDVSDADKAKLLEGAGIIENANQFYPDRVIPYLSLGKAYQFADQLDRAEIAYLLCIQNLPHDDTQAAKDTVIEAHYRLSQIYITRQNYKLALEQARTAVKGHPDSPAYLAGLASAQIQAKQLGDAGLAVGKGLRLDPNNQKLKALETLLNNDPDYLAIVADAWIARKQLAGARKIVDRSLSLDPNHKPTLAVDKKLKALGY